MLPDSPSNQGWDRPAVYQNRKECEPESGASRHTQGCNVSILFGSEDGPATEGNVLAPNAVSGPHGKRLHCLEPVVHVPTALEETLWLEGGWIVPVLGGVVYSPLPASYRSLFWLAKTRKARQLLGSLIRTPAETKLPAIVAPPFGTTRGMPKGTGG